MLVFLSAHAQNPHSPPPTTTARLFLFLVLRTGLPLLRTPHLLATIFALLA